MSRINSNVQSLIAQRVLQQNQRSLSTSLERLSTGLRISRGADDPAGLIASENLRSEIKSTNQAVANATRADQVVNIAEGGLQEVSSLLTELQGLITSSSSSAGISNAERQANQLQVDSILQTIDRISSATSFQGVKLLNGSFDFRTSNVASGVADYRINAAKYTGGSLHTDILVTGSAQQAGFYLSFGAASIDTGVNSQFTIEIGGVFGTRQLTFSSSTTLTNIAAAINSFASVTGTQAKASATGIKLFSSEFGSQQYTSIKVVRAAGIASGGQEGIYDLNTSNTNSAAASVRTTFANAVNTITDKGQDLQATINGIIATANGKSIRINTDFLDVETTLTTTQAQTLGAVGTHAFTITGGGADFQLSGQVNIAGRVSIGIQTVNTSLLGTSTTGYLNSLVAGQANNLVDGNSEQAQRIVNRAIEQVSSLRGRLGAFQSNTVGSTIRSLSVSVENTTAAESAIRDADFAAETAGLTRSQILVNASTNVLGLANQAPQSVLQLLG
ncbi:MAG: flagellin [Phycisphaerae bacterium]|nr:flagellin [Phycisphaerae bacterium]MBN8597336.1 flagellin [Planctomycetota bacterium]